MACRERSGRVLDLRLRGCGFKPQRGHYIVSLSKNINPSLVLVQPRKSCPFITERLLMGRKESNQTKQMRTFANSLDPDQARRFDILMIFLREFFKEVDFEKNQQTNKKHENLPVRQKVNPLPHRDAF